MAIKAYNEEVLVSRTNSGTVVNCSGLPTNNSATFMLRATARRLAIFGLGGLTPKGAKRNWGTLSYSRHVALGGVLGRTTSGFDQCPKYNEQGNFIGYGLGPARVSQIDFYPSTYSATSDIGVSPIGSDCLAITTAKLAASLSEERTQMQLAVSLGEAKQTATHLASVAGRLFHGYKAFRKGKLKESWRHLRGRDPVPVRNQRNFRGLVNRSKEPGWLDEASSAWMEYSYAWRPLLYDVDNAAKYLAQKSVGRTYALYRVSRAHKLWTQSDLPGLDNADQPLYRTVSTDFCHSRLTYEVYPDFLRKPSTLNELGFTDPASVVWELLPLSFVVDWFVNVGEVLKSLHEFQQWRVERGLQSFRTKRSRWTFMVRNYSGYSGIYQAFGMGQHYLEVTCNRALQGILPTAVPLRVKVSNPFDLQNGQLASALILLRYAFK